MDVSIIIVNYNTANLLLRCLDSIRKETSTVIYETIVVDNGSTDGSIDCITREYPNVVLIANDHNSGFATANNQGIAVAKGRYVLLLNSDTVILDGAIDTMVRHMDEHRYIGIAGCLQLNPDMTLQPSCRSFPSLWNIFTESTFLYKLLPSTRLFGGYYLSFFRHDHMREIDVVMGSFMFIRREVLNDIQGFDEDYFFYTEETDLCYRARQRGHRSFFCPQARIIHIGGGSGSTTLWSFAHLHRSQYQFINKHFRGAENAAMRFMKRFGILIRIPVYLLASLLTWNGKTFRKAVVHVRLAAMNFNEPIRL